MISINSIKQNTIEYGDYQTPPAFTLAVCEKLKEFYKISPHSIIEPTSGIGNFIYSSATTFKHVNNIYGIEINSEYCNEAENKLSSITDVNIFLFNEDIFSFDFSEIKEKINKDEQLLILGNPPWATNTQLSSIGSYNLPMKDNFKGNVGFDAITGKGNFDIAEYIILQLLSEFDGYNCCLAMLCKHIVAKNIVRDMDKYKFSMSNIDFFQFSAKEIFNINCEAGLLVINLGRDKSQICNVYNFNDSHQVEKQFGFFDSKFYSDLNLSSQLSDIDGICQFEWRQGIKHDCSKVMELKKGDNDNFMNGLSETVSLTIGDYIFPLVKSSDLKTYEITETRKFVVVTQKKVRADTSVIEIKDKKLWDYLVAHDTLLSSRKSKIYENAPKYSIFGVGDYSFVKYKVGISGFYKEPVFSILYGDYPIMMDDTCYFLGFNNYLEAYITSALLNSQECITFLKSIAFLESKRPYTKDVLKRIDLLKIAELTGYDAILEHNKKTGKNPVSYSQFKDYKLNLCKNNNITHR